MHGTLSLKTTEKRKRLKEKINLYDKPWFKENTLKEKGKGREKQDVFVLHYKKIKICHNSPCIPNKSGAALSKNVNS